MFGISAKSLTMPKKMLAAALTDSMGVVPRHQARKRPKLAMMACTAPK